MEYSNFGVIIQALIVLNIIKKFTNIIKDKGIFEIIIPQKEKINLSIYDVSGRKTITLIDDFLNPGIYKIKIDSKKFKKGIYFAVLKGKEKKIKKFVVLE
jgi:hypothetical protein